MRHPWTMAELRSEERWVKACIEGALSGVEVRQFDDGSLDGMHDLDIVYPDGSAAAVEVTAAADADSVELRKLMNDVDARWQEPGLAGGWQVRLLPSARARKLRSELPRLLRELEEKGLTDVRGDISTADPLAARATDLRIVQARQSGTGHPGSIYVTLELPPDKAGGTVPSSGNPLAVWIGDWLVEPAQADNPRKLGRSGAGERHLFVIVPGFTTAPAAAADLLILPGAPMPEIAPSLPPEVTHIWAMSTWSTADGFRWSPDRDWARFRKTFTIYADM